MDVCRIKRRGGTSQGVSCWYLIINTIIIVNINSLFLPLSNFESRILLLKASRLYPGIGYTILTQ